MSKLKQTKIPVSIGLDNLLEIAVEQGVIENEFNWKLVRERDGLTKQSKGVKWIEWNKGGSFKEQFEENGMIFSGLSPDNKLPEIIELKNHPWFVAVQFHPEFKSRPLAPHPLFSSFIKAAKNH